MKNLRAAFILGIIVFSTYNVAAQDFVYTPKNPAFGGFYYNYSWMLNSAQVQDNTVDPEQEISSSVARDPLKDFEESLNRQILSQLSRSIVRNQFGESTLTEGTYEIGSYQLNVTEELGGLNVVIIDIVSGNQTTIFIPYY